MNALYLITVSVSGEGGLANLPITGGDNESHLMCYTYSISDKEYIDARIFKILEVHYCILGAELASHGVNCKPDWNTVFSTSEQSIHIAVINVPLYSVLTEMHVLSSKPSSISVPGIPRSHATPLL